MAVSNRGCAVGSVANSRATDSRSTAFCRSSRRQISDMVWVRARALLTSWWMRMSRQECKRDKRERHQAALYRAACRTRRSINTHSGSSLSSSSQRGDDLHTVDSTEQKKKRKRGPLQLTVKIKRTKRVGTYGLHFADRLRAGAGRRSGSGCRQGRVRWGWPLLSRPRGAVDSGPAAVLSRPRLRSSR